MFRLTRRPGYNQKFELIEVLENRALENRLAEATNEKLYKAEYVGSGTFLISKPKRKKQKQRQTWLKNVSRGSRK